MSVLNRIGDAVVELAADATEGAAASRLGARAARFALSVLVVPVALVTFSAVLFVWHCATTRRSS